MTHYETKGGSVSTADGTLSHVRQLHLGDNLTVMRGMASETVDLVYLDPPFNSNRNYKIVFRGPDGLKPDAHLPAFEDVWKWDDTAERLFEELMRECGGQKIAEAVSGLLNVVGRDRLMAYLINMTPRLVEIHRLLNPSGSVYLHCDPTASHYLKVVMDAVFGRENFRNEIVWCYRGGGVPRRDFARKHDVILRYSKSNKFTFNPQFTDYSDASQALVKSRGGVSIDDRKRDLARGAHMPDWWTDINSLQTWSPERTGYPTQKPLKLLERIITASSNKEDVVMDPFSGCGTTMHAAEMLGRSWVGIDIEPMALSVLRERFDIADFDVDFEVRGIPSKNSYDEERWKQLAAEESLKFERAVIGQIDNCVPWRDRQVADRGIDGVVTFPVGRDEYRHAIVSVKGGRSLNPSMLRDLLGTVERETEHGVVAGVLVCAYEPTQGTLEETRLAGDFEAFGRWYPRLSVITLAELFRRMRENSPGLPLPATVPSGNGYRLSRSSGGPQHLFDVREPFGVTAN